MAPDGSAQHAKRWQGLPKLVVHYRTRLWWRLARVGGGGLLIWLAECRPPLAAWWLRWLHFASMQCRLGEVFFFGLYRWFVPCSASGG